MQTQENKTAPNLTNCEQKNYSSCCYFYHGQQNEKSILPIMQNKYNVLINNKFAEIKSVQKYKNPFDKNLQIHYSIPIDPSYVISNLTVRYQNLIVQGCVKQKQKIKAQYKQAIQKGQTVMMAAQSKNQNSVLNMKIGNIEPFQTIQVQFTLIGQLKCQLENQWTLRIPSHIGPRYHTQKDLIQEFLQYFTDYQPNFQSTYAQTKTTWDFSIHLMCTENISSYTCSSHKLKTKIVSQKQYLFDMNDQKVPQVDLQFTYSHQKPQTVFCTLGKKCAAVTFYTAPSEITNFDTYKGQYIFLLDRSGSMSGQRIRQANQALTLFLRSIPQNSYFNVISFGSDFSKMYPVSQRCDQKMLNQAVSLIEKIEADMGGTQIAQPLKDIYQTERSNLRPGFQKHIIVLTDGQVSNPNQVIDIIKRTYQEKVASTHMIGIGNGVSYSMIVDGAKQGGGQSLFIMKQDQLKRQIIFLLESIVSAKITNFKITTSNDQLIDINSIVIPKAIRKGRQVTIFMDLKRSATTNEQLKNTKIQISYEDVEQQNQMVHYNIDVQPDIHCPSLDKYKAYLQIQNIISLGKPQSRKQATQLSIKQNVLCRFTGFICRIKQNLLPLDHNQQHYVLKIKNALQGKSQLKKQLAQISVKTLTGKSLQFSLPVSLMVQDLKYLIQQAEGIPQNQQRIIYLGKQIQDGRSLEDYNIESGSVLHLVLRLRGGDGGTQKTIESNLWHLQILSQGSQIYSIPLNSEKILVSQINNKIYERYPQLNSIVIELSTKEKVLDKHKTLEEEGINSKNSQLNVNIELFMFNLFKNIINLIQFQGFWEYDEKIVQSLRLQQKIQAFLVQFQGDKRLAMTKCMIDFLSKNFPKQKDQISLILKKATKYIQKNKIVKKQ